MQHLRRIIREEKDAALASAAPDATGGQPGGAACPLGADPASLLQEELLARARLAAAALARERRRNAELVHRLQQLHGDQVVAISTAGPPCTCMGKT